jgi:hypothetical protein
MLFVWLVQVLAAIGDSGYTFNLAVNSGNFISLVGNMGALGAHDHVRNKLGLLVRLLKNDVSCQFG